MREPTFTKGYLAVFVSLSVKPVHLEPATELTTSGFIAILRRFIAAEEYHLPCGAIMGRILSVLLKY